ncbi:hypothetical protein [Paludisphaera rhizosphaerae]|uniref:hypothetical protein n=1 Tax=Paludisphaera rhizosphaerae TaxID=2711216 RepID=UPI0013EB7864|nr:hypothetical protein [Paludisphaera rhizosphaerae]
MGFYVAPSKWEIQHAGQIFSGQQYAATHGGELPDTPMWRMLEFRHALNERRFDHYHPNVGRILELANGSSPTTSVEVSPTWTNIMRGSTTPSMPPVPSYGGDGSSVGQDVDTPVSSTAVPEPSAVVMMALAMVSALLFAGFQRLRRD